jgi:rieske iron-sulfur protein
MLLRNMTGLNQISRVCWYSRTMTSSQKSCQVRQTNCEPPRRTLFMVGLSLGLAPWLTRAAAADEPATMPPQMGDQFVFLTGEKKGQVVKVGDLPLGGPQLQAYPIDPKTRVVRNASPLNLIVLIRLDTSSLSEETRTRAAGGVVAYSAVCTHQGCPVNMWTSAKKAMFCSCHGSVYDPRNAAQVLDGPAPRPLPSLGLKLENGEPVIAAGFSGRVGPTTQGR